MSGINESIILSVNRLKVEFLDSIGNKKIVTGTGFWLKNSQHTFFITNKHNLDPRLKLGYQTQLRLNKVEIELRFKNGDYPSFNTVYFEIDNPRILDNNYLCDCSLIVDPCFLNKTEGFDPIILFDVTEMADQNFFKEKVHLMDFVSFIGFPGDSGNFWYDEQKNLPIARIATVSSMATSGIVNSNIKTNEAVLVNGFSFSGSSGSPVILHEKSIKPGSGLINPSYVPAKLIGVMAGHFWDKKNTPEMFNHSGLSYFIRSTAILEIINSLDN